MRLVILYIIGLMSFLNTSASYAIEYHGLLVGVSPNWCAEDIIGMENALHHFPNWKSSYITTLTESQATKSNSKAELQDIGNLNFVGVGCIGYIGLRKWCENAYNRVIGLGISGVTEYKLPSQHRVKVEVGYFNGALKSGIRTPIDEMKIFYATLGFSSPFLLKKRYVLSLGGGIGGYYLTITPWVERRREFFTIPYLAGNISFPLGVEIEIQYIAYTCRPFEYLPTLDVIMDGILVKIYLGKYF